MSGTVVRRCPACKAPALLSDHGDIHTIGGARIVGVDEHGDSTIVCLCGETFVWKREPATRST